MGHVYAMCFVGPVVNSKSRRLRGWRRKGGICVRSICVAVGIGTGTCVFTAAIVRWCVLELELEFGCVGVGV